MTIVYNAYTQITDQLMTSRDTPVQSTECHPASPSWFHWFHTPAERRALLSSSPRSSHRDGHGNKMCAVSAPPAQILNAQFDYGYEYLGNGPRLVVTPLTDRIYVTATQALNLCMGCAPAGPAGTGKTESTKDLASALGKCCYVFNCSPEMDYQSLGDIFKGLAASGAWGCFDEFNRLIPEVLSVCTVQFKAVCDGVQGRVGAHRVEGDVIALDPTCGAYITMNPGYLGRSELPEGLKALFRPMTVMVPDLVLICENMLMAEGFIDAKVLASKFYWLYSLLKDLLSKQEHYDWGLRAIKSVLVVAGSFKRASPTRRGRRCSCARCATSTSPRSSRRTRSSSSACSATSSPGSTRRARSTTSSTTASREASELGPLTRRRVLPQVRPARGAARDPPLRLRDGPAGRGQVDVLEGTLQPRRAQLPGPRQDQGDRRRQPQGAADAGPLRLHQHGDARVEGRPALQDHARPRPDPRREAQVDHARRRPRRQLDRVDELGDGRQPACSRSRRTSASRSSRTCA